MVTLLRSADCICVTYALHSMFRLSHMSPTETQRI